MLKSFGAGLMLAVEEEKSSFEGENALQYHAIFRERGELQTINFLFSAMYRSKTMRKELLVLFVYSVMIAVKAQHQWPSLH